MTVSTQQWQLFGYDVRNVGQLWLAGWRDLLWGYDSPILRHLDEPVKVWIGQDTRYFQAGQETDAQETRCEAIMLPDELVLAKELNLPIAVEGSLEGAMALEIKASSPFPESDTGAGWQIVARDGARLRVQLVVVSLSSVKAHLGTNYDWHEAQSREVWARVGDSVVVIHGFGESNRKTRYRRRLVSSALVCAYSLAVVVLLFACSAGFKQLELGRIKQEFERVTTEAGPAATMRTRLASAEEAIEAANQMVTEYPSPHVELARLTRLLDDDAWLMSFSMQGRNIRIQGRAADATSIMQRLTDTDAYAQVSAPQAIRKLGNSDTELFYLDIALDDEVK